jgi:cob(I)alamin adenosyltransferase
MRPPRLLAAVLAVWAAIGLAACGSDNSSAPVAGSSAAICDEVDQLKSSVGDLSKSSSVDQFTSKLQGVEQDLQDLKGQLADAKQSNPQVTAFSDAVNAFQDQIDAAGGVSDLPQLATSASDVATTFQRMVSSLNC